MPFRTSFRASSSRGCSSRRPARPRTCASACRRYRSYTTSTRGPPPVAAELARLANDELAELCTAHPDRFMGFAASLAMNDPDAAVREAQRATKDLGALGVQIFTNVNGVALDEPRFAPLFAAMAELDRPIWVHPARASAHPDYLTEDRSKYELWWVFGWPYETAIFMSRLIF